jgi:hypothetical protein
MSIKVNKENKEEIKLFGDDTSKALEGLSTEGQPELGGTEGQSTGESEVEVTSSEDSTPSTDEPTSEEEGIKVFIDTDAALVDTKPVSEKKVKIKLNINHRCNIGGEWYDFKKDGEYSVPEGVKEILKEAGLLSPL